MTRHRLRFLSGEDVRRALPMAEAVEAMKRAFAALARGEAEMPPRTHLEVPRCQGNVLFMPCYLPGEGRLGVKVVSLFDANPGRGLPRIQAVVVVLDGTDGSPQAVIEGASLTALRTGAASGAATDLLARPDAATAAVFGAGVQGRTQLEALAAVRPIRRAWVFDADPDRAEAFAREMSETLGLVVAAARTPAEALRGADVVCTATTAKTPVFADGDLPPGAHLNAVGAYQPSAHEIPVETVERARVVVDHRASALAEAGDLLIPIQRGRFAAERIHAELGEIVLGLKAGRASDAEVTLFKSVGLAIQDLAAAAAVLDGARRLGLGTEVEL
jgi:ornithine cyclodeaminase/alanine dehydrogenase-like protein (mu-crystallin family)